MNPVVIGNEVTYSIANINLIGNDLQLVHEDES